MMRLVQVGWGVVVAAAAASCMAPKDENGDGVADGLSTVNSVTRVAPSTPVGSVSGLVLTTRRVALAEATVTLLLGNAAEPRTTSTTIDGAFSFSDVPAGGQALVTVSKPGFAAVRTTVTVPANAGNVPINAANGSAGVVLLQELAASLRFNVFTHRGHPARKAKAQLEVAPSGFVQPVLTAAPIGVGSLSFDGAVDDLGALVFTNVPSPLELARLSGGLSTTNYTLVIDPLDEDEDGAIDFLGTVRTYSAEALFTELRGPLVLEEARNGRPLSVLASNLESLRSAGTSSAIRNTLRATDKIIVLFNQPVLDASLSVKATLEDCVTPFAVTGALTNLGTLLTITPGAPWVVGTKYNLAIRVTPADATGAANTLSLSGYAFGFDPNMPKPLMSATFLAKKAAGSTTAPMALAQGDTLYVTFDTPVRATGGVPARVFVAFDLNTSGGIGSPGDLGEQGLPFASGLPVTLAEPATEAASTFTCAASGYSMRWAVTLGALPATPVPAGTAIRVAFARDLSALEGFQTIWGLPAMPMAGEFGGSLVVAP